MPRSTLQYSTRLRAASTPRVPRLTAIIGSLPTARHHGTNSSTPTWLVSSDRQARSSRVGRRSDRPDPVLPVVAGDEVAARVAQHRDPELADQVGDVGAETAVVGARMAGFEDALVHAAAHVLDERAVQPGIDLADPVGEVEGQGGLVHGDPAGHSIVAGEQMPVVSHTWLIETLPSSFVVSRKMSGE